MNKTIFLYSGEGTHNSDSSFKLLKYSTLWVEIKDILKRKLNLDLESFWTHEINHHKCPDSPLLTVVTQICLSDLWRRWGYQADVLVGHSTGELTAAYEAGLYSLENIILLAHQLGTSAANLEGAMLHGYVDELEIADLPTHISSFNFKDDSGTHVTVSGYTDEMDRFLKNHPNFVRMQIPHPWHHPDYSQYLEELPLISSHQIEDGRFLSGVTASFETCLDNRHWHDWLVNPIDFIKTMQTLRKRCGKDGLTFIEIGFHPILEKCLVIFENRTYASSMFRGEDEIKWILYQRKHLDHGRFLTELSQLIESYKPGIDYDVPLAYQGFDSLKFTEFSQVLQPLFPGIAPQAFYRFKTINQLVNGFGAPAQVSLPAGRNVQRNGVVITGMSCRLPSSIETLPQFWDMLTSNTDQVRHEPGRSVWQAGYLNDTISRFDHHFFNISLAEARTMDPQQILALELTEMLWRDAGIDPQTLDRSRVGVYIGVWNQEYIGDRSSVYYPSGTNPSIIASRISYHYDLRGPSWVSNTACSSSLVAIHYAAKDIEAGRVDFAIAGGVNMLLDQGFSSSMRNSGFLSADFRCKAFDDSANGYVRAEGGGLVLLANRSLAETFYAELTGSAVNQNGGRSQVITAPHPEAQEELILHACQDAGIAPQEIDYIECHGTGTKIGDPIEISAIQNTVASNRSETCYIGSVKSNIGHLESAAGIAGLIKSVAILNHGLIPPNLHFNAPNKHIDFESHPIRVATEETPIDHQANIGISSFGFGGSNAHIIVKGAEASVRKDIKPLEIPFDRQRSSRISEYLTRIAPIDSEPVEQSAFAAPGSPGDNARQIIQTLMANVTSIELIDPHIELLDQGLDSMSETEMLRQLEETFNIELEPDVLSEFPFIDQFIEEVERRVASNGKDPEGELVTRETIVKLVNDMFFQLTGIESVDPDIELTDQGLDSMSATELLSQLENTLKIELWPELLFEHPLRDQFVDKIYALSGGGIN